MTKEEFAQMERAQQRIWKELAENGEDAKPDAVYIPFSYGCPACTIADCAYNKINIDKGQCNFCPVTMWRESTEPNPSCQGRYDEIDCFTGTLEDISKLPVYGQWVVLVESYSNVTDCTEDKLIEERKKVALEISKLEFYWLAEYEEVELSQKIKDYLKGEEEYGC